MALSLIFHNAITIYLSGLFDYFPYWTDRHISSPTISSSEARGRVQAILSMVGLALKHTSLSAILFLFPLRVAGARARCSEQRNVIAGLLGDIDESGFVVAGAFVGDLKELWATRC